MPEHPFEYLDGGIAPIHGFENDCEAILKLQETSAFAGEDASFLIVATPPIALVSLLAFAEGFFKSTFGAAGNMCPTALSQFVAKRPEIAVPVDDLLLLQNRVDHRIGSLTAERLDFGSAKKINGNFRDLLSLTAFGSGDIDKYETIISIRNQLVHHGGIITAKYFRQQRSSQTTADEIYWGSVEVTQRTVIDAVAFLQEVAVRLTEQCFTRMKELEGDKVLESGDDRYLIFEYFRGSFRAFEPRKRTRS